MGDGHGRATAGRAAQDAIASCVVDILFLAVGACIVHGQVVEAIVGKGGRRAAHRAAGDVALGVVAAGIGLARLGAAGRACLVEPAQLVRVGGCRH
jgi:hypothetical protein